MADSKAGAGCAEGEPGAPFRESVRKYSEIKERWVCQRDNTKTERKGAIEWYKNAVLGLHPKLV